MLKIIQWTAERMPGERVLAFLASWDGRYYWDYPRYEPNDRMGGAEGFRRLVDGAHAVGAKVMPMFGANAANREQPSFTQFAAAATLKPDGDRMDINWVDWDNDRHQDGWLSYMNLGVLSWRNWMVERISTIATRFGVDAYFLDIVGGWVNNTAADMHEGTR
jgi:glycosidase